MRHAAMAEEMAMKILSQKTSSVFKRDIPNALAEIQQHVDDISGDLRKKHKGNENCNHSVTKLSAKHDERSQIWRGENPGVFVK